MRTEPRFAEKTADDSTWEELGHIDYQEMKVSDLLIHEGEKIVYEYDFGDGWEHEVFLEKILPGEENELEKPVCLAGKMNCPPEDCGGIRGYLSMLEILKDPDHEEYESFIDWLGGKFNPEHFNLNKVNRLLKSKNFGCVELDD